MKTIKKLFTGMLWGGLIASGGILLQALFDGGIDASLWSQPLNILVTIAIICLAVLLKTSYSQSKMYRMILNPIFSTGYLTIFALILIIMGWVVQGNDGSYTHWWQYLYREVVRSWPFVLLIVTLIFQLIVIGLSRRPALNTRYIAFALNHFSLALLLIAGLMGAADKEEYKVVVPSSGNTQSGFTLAGKSIKLPFMIEQHALSKEWYPNKLQYVKLDPSNGKILNQNLVSLDPGITSYNISQHQIKTLSNDFKADTLQVEIDGKIFNLHINPKLGLAPISKEEVILLQKGIVRQYHASLHFSTEKESETAELQVNKPAQFDGYYIYLESYDKKLGLILKLVKDPWLPLAYIALCGIMGAAILALFTSPKVAKL